MTATRRIGQRRRPRPPVRRVRRQQLAVEASIITPVLTAYTDEDPCPRVEVLITHLPPTVDTVTVWRSWAGTRSVVRGGNRAEVSGALLLVDYEVPLGLPVTYWAVGYTAAGVPMQESPSATVTVSAPDTWIQDPLDPTSAMRAGMLIPGPLMVSGGSFAAPRYRRAGQRIAIHGSRLPVGRGDVRQAAAQVPLLLDSDNPTTTAGVYEVLDQADPLCVRAPADLVPALTGLVYLAVDEYVPDPDTGWQGTMFTLEGDSVRPPGAGIVVQPRTYADLLDEAATYADLTTLYPTYLDLLRGS